MQQSLLNPKRFEGLFSEHYVNKRFPETDLYKKLSPPNEIRKKLSPLIKDAIKNAPRKKEAQLEEDFIQPLLKILGINYIVQVSNPAGEVDYAFFKTEEERAAADARPGKKYEGAVALADAKRWERPFDARGGKEGQDENPNAIPTKQIANYIYETGVDWGVLTDGRLWRLYNRNTTPVSQSFFEINLVDAAEDPEGFHLFYALFSGAAFAEKAQEFVLKESESYWAEIGGDLKEKAYNALELLCNGFRRLGPDLEIKDIYEGAVILLYRLLFILYAEDKGLLPRAEDAYRRYSLHEILKEVENGRRETFSETRPMLYDRLSHLFRLIDEGDESLGVYQYNGGLFKDEGLPFLPAKFLTDHPVPDRYLAAALKLIAFAEDKKGRGRHPVDYSELDVRHLGSIYEGLLEFHPSSKDSEIELLTDKGERKATGSYYTPGYIVNYIVENTLGPLTENLKTPEEVLALKVLDPAMGSGHFLVGAVDFIGRRCLGLAEEEAEATEKDYQREAVERCIYGVDLNPLAVELAKLSLWLHTVAKGKPLSFLDHHLKLGNSLVGARVDDLGEIPKKAKKKEVAPTRNLFATRLEQAMGTAINEVMGILGRGTEAIEDVTFKEDSLKRAERRLAPFKAVADAWVSTYFGNDVTDAVYAEGLAALARSAEETLALAPVGEAVRMSHGDEHGVGREFFHWELEFPEVFFDKRGLPKENPGFDTVIGNPPYDILAEKETGINYEQEKNYYFANPIYRKIIERKLNYYRFMIANGLEVLRNKGYLSFIVPLTLVGDQHCYKLRELLFAKRKVLKLEAIPTDSKTFRVFPEADLTTCVFVCENDTGGYRLAVNTYWKGFLNKRTYGYEEDINTIKNLKDPNFPIPLCSSSDFRVINIFNNLGYGNLGEYVNFFQGEINTGADYYLLSEIPTKYEIIKGAHIGRYTLFDKPKQGRRYFAKEDIYESELKKETKISLGLKERIVMQRGSSVDADTRLLATFLPAGKPCSHNINSVILNNKNSPFFILALLNSRIYEWRFRLTSTNNTINHYELSVLPFRRINFETPSAERNKLTKTMINFYALGKYDEIIINVDNILPKTASGEFVAFQKDATGLEEKSDVVHDFLAFLAQQMLVMNAEKQRLAREFLGWLDGETAGNLDEFRPKKYQDFWAYDFDEFYKWLKKNHEDFKAADHAKLQAEFDKYKSQVVELNDKIERTDRLIDDIVYILYGLTEEEIEIVEGSFKVKGK